VVAVDVRVGALVTVTVLVLVNGGGTSTVVVTVEMLVVVDDELAAEPAASTPQANRLLELPAALSLTRLSAFW
jgi:hypothetical protein